MNCFIIVILLIATYGVQDVDRERHAIVRAALSNSCILSAMGRACEKIASARRIAASADREDSTRVRQDDATPPWRFFHTLVAHDFSEE
jgi:hypothetical protein